LKRQFQKWSKNTLLKKGGHASGICGTREEGQVKGGKLPRSAEKNRMIKREQWKEEGARREQKTCATSKQGGTQGRSLQRRKVTSEINWHGEKVVMKEKPGSVSEFVISLGKIKNEQPSFVTSRKKKGAGLTKVISENSESAV